MYFNTEMGKSYIKYSSNKFFPSGKSLVNKCSAISECLFGQLVGLEKLYLYGITLKPVFCWAQNKETNERQFIICHS